jgi:hypothetical protein
VVRQRLRPARALHRRRQGAGAHAHRRGWQERDRAWAQALAAALALHEEEGLVARERYVLAPVYIGRPGTGLPQFERGGPPSIMTLIDEIRGRIADPEIRALAQALEPA